MGVIIPIFKKILGKQVLSCNILAGVNYYNLSLRKGKLYIHFDPTIPLLGIYPKYILAHVQNDVCMKIFIAALTYNRKDWKQSESPSTQN